MKTVTFDETKFKLVPIVMTEGMKYATECADKAAYERTYGEFQPVYQASIEARWAAQIGAAPFVSTKDPS